MTGFGLAGKNAKRAWYRGDSIAVASGGGFNGR